MNEPRVDYPETSSFLLKSIVSIHRWSFLCERVSRVADKFVTVQQYSVVHRQWFHLNVYYHIFTKHMNTFAVSISFLLSLPPPIHLISSEIKSALLESLSFRFFSHSPFSFSTHPPSPSTRPSLSIDLHSKNSLNSNNTIHNLSLVHAHTSPTTTTDSCISISRYIKCAPATSSPSVGSIILFKHEVPARIRSQTSASLVPSHSKACTRCACWWTRRSRTASHACPLLHTSAAMSHRPSCSTHKCNRYATSSSRRRRMSSYQRYASSETSSKPTICSQLSSRMQTWRRKIAVVF